MDCAGYILHFCTEYTDVTCGPRLTSNFLFAMPISANIQNKISGQSASLKLRYGIQCGAYIRFSAFLYSTCFYLCFCFSSSQIYMYGGVFFPCAFPKLSCMLVQDNPACLIRTSFVLKFLKLFSLFSTQSELSSFFHSPTDYVGNLL